MRVRRLIDRTSDERGAVLAIVVLSLIATLGMVALSIDGGGMVLERRAMVNANDAAALAFAESCAHGDGEADAVQQADRLAGANVTYSSHVSRVYWKYIDPPGGNCDSTNGTVEVHYKTYRDMAFAPIVGFPNTVEVAATARATWGPVGAVSNSTPIELDSSQLIDRCGFDPTANPPQPPVGTPCSFWYESSAASSQFGVMNLDLWGVPGDSQCSSAGDADRNHWLTTGYPGLLGINDPPPTYVCLDTGANDRNWQILEDQVGKEKLFPINDPTGFSGYPQVERSGANCTDADATAGLCTPDKYSIVGFAILFVTNLYDGNDLEVRGTPAQTGTCSPTHDFTATGLNQTWDLGTQLCNITNLHFPDPPPDGDALKLYPKLSWKVRGNTIVGQINVDYQYDATTHVVTWLRTADQTSVTVAWAWNTPAQPGACGPHFDGKPTDKCLLTEYRGFTTNSGEPCTQPPCPPSNIIAVKLTN